MPFRVCLSILAWISLYPSVYADNDGKHPYLNFANREQHVEIEQMRGALDLQKPFTIELSVRWDTDILDKMLYFAGDEVWKGMSEKIAASDIGGWVIRTSHVKDANKQSIDFTVASSSKGKKEWLSVTTSAQKIKPNEWHHIAVCRTKSEIRIYWNGKLAGRRQIAGIELHSSPTNVFLGVRKDAWPDRETACDIRAFRIVSSARYTEPFTPLLPLTKVDGTITLLHFSDADGLKVPDISGNKRHGSINGPKLVVPKK